MKNIPDLITPLKGYPGARLLRAVRIGYAGWMFCAGHAGSIFDLQCFKNGIACGMAAWKGEL